MEPGVVMVVIKMVKVPYESQPLPKVPKKKRIYNKYHNIKVVTEEGLKFDSTWEKICWDQLIKLQESR